MSEDDIRPSDVAEACHYHGQYRPQFHYTPIQGHIGDATSLICHKGEYHLFYMYDPWSRNRREHRNWGHAISADCLHWRELPPILDTLIDHGPGSGSGLVDWNDSSGLRRGPEKTLVVFYTDYARGTCIAYNNDRGHLWVRHRDNPILRGTEDIRDPYVLWYPPARSWRMVRYEAKGFSFYASSNLVDWTHLSRIDGFCECPDMCRPPLDGDRDRRKWVLIDGDSTFFIGEFDGTHFQPESERLQVNYGRLYATQSWKHTFEGDGPAVQIGFMGYVTEPRLTWIGQMCFPCEQALRTCPEGIRLFRYPIETIKSLYVEQHVWEDQAVRPGTNILDGIISDAFDIRAEIEVGDALIFGFDIRGERITYHAESRELSWTTTAPLEPVDGRIRLRILLDRSSIEIFGNDGRVSITDIFFPDASNRDVRLFTEGGSIRPVSLEVNRLESVWQERELALGYAHTVPSGV
jgi:fructan beta-fructosidase